MSLDVVELEVRTGSSYTIHHLDIIVSDLCYKTQQQGFPCTWSRMHDVGWAGTILEH